MWGKKRKNFKGSIFNCLKLICEGRSVSFFKGSIFNWVNLNCELRSVSFFKSILQCLSMYSSLSYEDRLEMVSSFWHRCNLTHNNGLGGRKRKRTKLIMDIRKFNLGRSQVREGNDKFEPVLNMHTPLYTTLTLSFLYAPLQLSSQRKIILR